MEIFRKIEGTIQDLESSQRMTLRELNAVKRSLKKGLDATVELRGTFKSIEEMFRNHEARIAALEKRFAS